RTCRWSILGQASEVHKSSERQRVLAVLADAPEGMSLEEIRGAAHLSSSNAARCLLFDMTKAGEIERLRRGLYGLPGTRTRMAEALKRKLAEEQEGRPLKYKGFRERHVQDVRHAEASDMSSASNKSLKSNGSEERNVLMSDLSGYSPNGAEPAI